MSYENEQMIDKRIGDMLTKKMNEPAVSPDFVERMTVLAAGIEQGRAAEEALADKNRTLNGAESLDLCARSVVGRLMLTQTPPKGVSVDMMVSQLKNQPRFREAVSGPREGVLYELRTGEIFRRINTFVPAGGGKLIEDQPADPEAGTPEVKAPQIGSKNRLP